MLKILILSHCFYPDVGGIETNSEILGSAFHEFGAEVHIVSWTKETGTKQFPFNVIRNPGINKLLREHRWADVVLENNPCLRLSWPNIFIHKPLVVAVNTWVSRVSGTKGIRDKLKHLWFRRTKNIIAVSDAIRKKEWPQAVVIENPYNNRLFKTLPDIKKEIKFVFLGRLVSDKGADQAIRAISALVNEKILNRDSIQLTIIGDGPEKKHLSVLIKKMGLESAVQLTGVLKEQALVDCLNGHQYILVPSAWQEPYGNVVLEGMACGCIPVASNGGGLPEAVGEAGFLFERNNLDDMVNILKEILKDSGKNDLIKAKADCHLKQHTIELVAKKYFKILQLAAG